MICTHPVHSKTILIKHDMPINEICGTYVRFRHPFSLIAKPDIGLKDLGVYILSLDRLHSYITPEFRRIF